MFFCEFFKNSSEQLFLVRLWTTVSDLIEYLENVIINYDLDKYLTTLSNIIDFVGSTSSAEQFLEQTFPSSSYNEKMPFGRDFGRDLEEMPFSFILLLKASAV